MDKGLVHRADCASSGSEPQFAAALKDDLEPIYLCKHHLRQHTAQLVRQGWRVVHLNDDCDTEVVPA